MARGIPLRTLLLGLTLAFGLFVLLLALSGADDALRSAGPPLDEEARSALLRALLWTQFLRGLIAIILALLFAGVIGAAASRLFTVRAPVGPWAPAPDTLWLREAHDVADLIGRIEGEHAEGLEALARQRADLHRLLEAVSEGILQIDDAGRVVRANRAARRLLSLPDDAVGRHLGAVARSAELRDLLQNAFAEPALPPREIAFEERTLIVTARPLARGADAGPGEAGGIAVAVADLTALRRLESVRRDFVANASHELKTPLTSIRGYAETLLDETLPPETRRQFIATISNNADRLQNIVDDLLDLSRLESGGWQPSLRSVSPAAAVREAWRDFETRAQERRVEFDVEADASDEVLADASALRQILANLFDNALRYTAHGRIRCRIVEWPGRTRAPGERDRRSRDLAIEVRDTGSGIPGDALPRIFERFYRVDPARSRAEGGTGLGLAIVKHLAESMGGTVEAESELGRGTTVRVVLPAAPLRAGGADGLADA